MKNTLLLFAFILSISLNAQQVANDSIPNPISDTLVSISKSTATGLNRKVMFKSFCWNTIGRTMALTVTIWHFDAQGNVINTQELSPYDVTLVADDVTQFVDKNGNDVAIGAPGAIGEYTFLRGLSFQPIPLISEIVAYINKEMAKFK